MLACGYQCVGMLVLESVHNCGYVGVGVYNCGCVGMLVCVYNCGVCWHVDISVLACWCW